MCLCVPAGQVLLELGLARNLLADVPSELAGLTRLERLDLRHASTTHAPQREREREEEEEEKMMMNQKKKRRKDDDDEEEEEEEANKHIDASTAGGARLRCQPSFAWNGQRRQRWRSRSGHVLATSW